MFSKMQVTMFLMCAVAVTAVDATRPPAPGAKSHELQTSALRFATTKTLASIKAPTPTPVSPAPLPPVKADSDKEPTILVPGQHKSLSVAMQCVMSLLFLYFVVVVLIKLIVLKKQLQEFYDVMKPKAPSGEEGTPVIVTDEAKAAEQPLTGEAPKNASDWVKEYASSSKLEEIYGAMVLVPMFCILITFCRLRARVDLDTEPQVWAKTFMHVATGSLFVQIFAVLIPGDRSCGAAIFYIKKLVDMFALLGLYVGVGFICASIFQLKYQEDKLKAL